MSWIREVKFIDFCTYFLLPPLLAALLWTRGEGVFNAYLSWDTWVFYVLAGVISYILLKRFIIGMVLIYKMFAPLSVRQRCRFTPTCSTYMILSIKKYGLVYGIIKGIHRLLRCKPPNGGVDYP